MSNGVLCFANNNGKINYILQAQELAKRVRKYLDLPTSIVTSTPCQVDESYFDKVIHSEHPMGNFKRYYDGANTHVNIPFNNAGRISSYDISPYDQTLVLDTDVIICNSDLKNAFDSIHDFQIYKDCTDLTTWRTHSEFNYINDKGIPFYWATVFCFKKTKQTKLFFELMKHIKQEWTHYSNVFELGSRNFRNDHIFSIAIHMMNGFSDSDWAKNLPGSLYYTLDRDMLHKIDKAKLVFLLEKENLHGEYVLSATNNMNVHVMNKCSLERLLNV